MIASLALSLCLGQNLAPDQLVFSRESAGLRFEWRDAEDRLSGTVTPAAEWRDAEERPSGTVAPAAPRAGDPLDVSLSLGRFDGVAFSGPVQLTFERRAPGRPGAAARLAATATPAPGGKGWGHRFVLPEEGEWTLEVSFFTTRAKVVRGTLKVGPAPLPVALKAGLALALIGAVVGTAAYRVLRKKPAAPTPT